MELVGGYATHDHFGRNSRDCADCVRHLGVGLVLGVVVMVNELKPNCAICHNFVCKDMHPLAQPKYIDMCLKNGKSHFIPPLEQEGNDEQAD